MKYQKEFEVKFNELLNIIAEYESDTFSAIGSRLTIEEAEEVAYKLLIPSINRLIEGDTMDGLMITEVLEEIRG